MFRSSLEDITNTKLNVSSWRQASLPLSFGGLGIRKAEDLAYPAYLSSVYHSADLSNKILEKFGLNILDSEISLLLQLIFHLILFHWTMTPRKFRKNGIYQESKKFLMKC